MRFGASGFLVVGLTVAFGLSSGCGGSSGGGSGTAAPKTEATGAKPAEGKAGLTKKEFGKTKDGAAVDLYTMTNRHGIQVGVINYGATVQSIRTPDRDGKMADIALGFDTLDGYLGTHPYFGAVVGRYGNRVAKGHFKLDGKDYKLAINNGENSLHGGLKGFDKVVWTARDASADAGSPAVELTYLSKDGEEGYPGNLTVTVRYTLTDDDEVRIDYTAKTDKTTVTNITNHSYFNLAGAGSGDILKHQMTLHASKFTPVDAGLIPTGELKPVKGTPFDFTTATAIGARIDGDDQQLKFGLGYDHNWVIDQKAPGELTLAAEVSDAASGRTLQVSTTEPGVQFYTGNFLDGTIKGKDGKVYAKRNGLCLETQHFPDSPNHPAFPTTTLKPGETRTSRTVWKFGVAK